jgi:hypothetical protein
MKTLFQTFFNFLETKTGFLLLGFLVTTVGGSILNSQIQGRTSENEHSFEMYKIRLKEAKELQKDVLNSANARAFAFHQVVAQLAHPEDYKREEVQNYWNINAEKAKDHWNRELYYFHAQARVLFSAELADTLLLYSENQPIVHDQVVEKLDAATYEKTKPRSLHGALVDVNATVYHLLRKCGISTTCDQEKLMRLAERQMNDLERIQSCFAYRVSSELLRYPYGPKAQSVVDMPPQCRIAPMSEARRAGG